MISFTNTDELRRPGSTIIHQVTIGAPVNKDISRLISRIPSFSVSMKPNEKTPRVSNIGLVANNGWGHFNFWDSGSILNGVIWQNAPITIKLGVRMALGIEELVAVYTGELANVKPELGEAIVELVILDPLAKLRRDTIHYDLIYDEETDTGTRYVQEAPAYIVKDLLTEAGLSGSIDSTSFDAAILDERSAGYRVRSFPVPRGTWWSAISQMLQQVNAGLRYNASGQYEYVNFRPESADPVYDFNENRTTARIVASQSAAGVINKYRVQREQADGSLVDATVQQNSTSITNYGEVSEEHVSKFLEDGPAEAIAAERLGNTEEPFTLYEVEDSIVSLPVELGDVVTVTSDIRGIGTIPGQVMGKSIDSQARRCLFTVLSNSLATDDWAYTHNSQSWDGGHLIW